MKRIALGFLGALLALLILLLLAVVWLLMTPGGTRWLLDNVEQRVPELSLTYQSGTLLQGVTLSRLRFENATTRFAAEQAVLEWSPRCLLAGRICVDRLELAGPQVEVTAAADQDESTDGAPPSLDLPLPVTVESVVVRDLQVATPTLGMSLEALALRLDVSREGIEVDGARINGLALQLPAAADSETETDSAEGSGEPIELPEVRLPFGVQVSDLRLTDAVVERGDSRWTLRELALSARLDGGLLRIGRLALDHEQGELALKGRVRLEGDHPLSATLSARADLPQLGRPQSLAAELSGSAAALEVSADLRGAFELSLVGEVAPLRPQVPFDVRILWQHLRWPLEEPVAESLNGGLELSGNLERYRLRFDSLVRGPDFPEARIAVAGQGDLDAFVADQVRVRTLGGTVAGQAEVAWQDFVRWSTTLALEDIQPGLYWPEYPGRIGGEIEASGRVEDGNWSLKVPAADLRGELQDRPFAVTGSIARSLQGAWRFDRVRLVSEANTIALDGGLDERWQLSGRFDLGALQTLYAPLQGDAAGEFAVSGPLARPNVDLTLSSGGIQYEDVSLGGADIEARVRALGTEASELDFVLRDVVRDDVRLAEVGGTLTGTRDDHRLVLNVDGEPASVEVILAGALGEDYGWRGTLSEATVQAFQEAWQLAEPTAIAWLPSSQRVRLEAHCWRREDASLCLREPTELGAAGDVSLALSGYRLGWLGPRLPEGTFWEGPLAAEVVASWGAPEGPVVEARARSEDGTLLISQESAPALELDYQSIGVQLALREGRLDLGAQLASEGVGDAELALRTELGEGPRPLDGQVELSGLQLALVQPFVPQLQNIAGVLNVSGRLEGTTAAPRFVGDVDLAADQINAPALPLRIGAVELSAAIDGQQGTFEGRFESGEGGADLQGAFSWEGEQWQLEARVSGERMLVVYPPIARLQVNPELKIEVRPKLVQVTGQVVVPSGTITLQELPAGAVAVSEDVVVVRRPEEEGAQQAAVTGPPDAPPTPGWRVRTDIELVFGDRVEIAGYGLTGRLTGQIRIRQEPGGVPQAVGELRIEEGRYEAYGQRLTIRTGQLIFGGPVTQPQLNVEAVREVEDVIAGVRVTGEPDAPEITLFSEPGMPQEDILSYIVRGRPLRDAFGGGGSEEQFLAQAALAVGVFGGERYATAIAEEFGIEDFEIGTGGEGSDTQFQLSGYLNPNLFVQYGIGVFQPGTELTLRYRLNRNFYIEAMSGLENAVDLFYEFEF